MQGGDSALIGEVGWRAAGKWSDSVCTRWGNKGGVTGGPIVGGRYRLTGNGAVSVGLNHVDIRSPLRTGRKVQCAPNTAVEEEVVEQVAPRFNVRSTITVEVQRSRNAFDFDVQPE